MKYDKVRERLIEILNSFGYQYSLYNDSGQRTSNPFEARYIYNERPNMMFIIDDSKNTLELHKSNFNFKTFKKILTAVRRMTREYFINLDVSNYNQSIKPRDFSQDIMRRRYNQDKDIESVSESKDENGFQDDSKYLTETHHSVRSYVYEDTIHMCHNGRIFTIESSLYDYVPYFSKLIVEKFDREVVNEKINEISKIRKSFKALDKKSSAGTLSEEQKKLYKKAHNILNSISL